eukprot:TRINITY_DN525_c0_g1_i1.p1 TRINITY_DN525_c0_g1~~TRINITY_DN525_c0_g1_i1.p1  ORF type:complete len:140 (+),score=33.80 TRINITY_DN525_c0_g1_i1:121-540(+)
MAGVSISQSCISDFESFKKDKSTDSFIVFRMNDKLSQVIVDKKGEASTYDDFIKEFQDKTCSYIVRKIKYSNGSDGDRVKIVFYLWTPSSASLKHKMVFAATSANFKRSLMGVQTEIQAGDVSSLNLQDVIEKCKRHSQ